PKNAGNDPLELLRNLDLAAASPIGAAGVVIELEIGRERLQQIAEPSPQDDRTLGLTSMYHDEIMLLRDLLHAIQLVGRGPVLPGQLFAGEVGPPGEGLVARAVPPLFAVPQVASRGDTNRHGNDFGGIDVACRSGIRKQLALAIGKKNINGLRSLS